MKTLTVILYNLRSTYNVGAIFRTCDGLGVSEVLLVGYTPFFDKGLPHEQLKLRNQIHKSALGAEETVSWRRFETIDAAIADCRARGIQVVALEQWAHSIDLSQSNIQAQLGDQIALILGEEVKGIQPEILANCDALLEIPMAGQKESFNVSIAGAIAIWELQKSSLRRDDRSLLRA